MKRIRFYFLFYLFARPAWEEWLPEFSTAGFFRLKDTGREVYRVERSGTPAVGFRRDKQLICRFKK